MRYLITNSSKVAHKQSEQYSWYSIEICRNNHYQLSLLVFEHASHVIWYGELIIHGILSHLPLWGTGTQSTNGVRSIPKMFQFFFWLTTWDVIHLEQFIIITWLIILSEVPANLLYPELNHILIIYPHLNLHPPNGLVPDGFLFSIPCFPYLLHTAFTSAFLYITLVISCHKLPLMRYFFLLPK
jgi:hypothetical protein